MTRRAYPKANSDLLELLAIDHFIDAIPDTDIRLRLREVGPKSIAEAERIAVRLDAHKTADRSRGKPSVRSVQTEETKTEQKLNELSEQMKKLMKDMNDYKARTQSRGLNQSESNSRYGAQNSTNRNGRQNWNRAGNGAYPQRPFAKSSFSKGRVGERKFQENGQKSSLGTETRQQALGPRKN